MTQTIDLIAKLSSQAKPVKPMLAPIKWIIYLLIILGIYGAVAQMILGLRADIALQFTRPLFIAEIVLMALLFITSVVSATLNIYPDFYQKSRLIKLPYIIFALFLGFLIFQIFIPNDIKAIIPQGIFHKVECTICIMFLSFIPAILIFTILKKGASVRPFQAGSLAVLTASSLGYLILRFSEANDSVSHLLIWHYLPILFFAGLGALMGKLLLKW